jgi:hypothetical protein
VKYKKLDAAPEDFGQQNQLKYRRDGKDYIDLMYEQLTFDQFTGAMWFTIGKYFARMTKKDDIEQEAKKIADYSSRYLEKVKIHKAKLCKDTALKEKGSADG